MGAVKYDWMLGKLRQDDSASISVSSTDVSPGSAYWNAKQIQDFDVTTVDPTDGKILVYRAASSAYVLETKPTTGTSPDWGDIDGTLSNQTDLQTALDAKVASTNYNTHVGSSSIHFTEGSIDHRNISSVGVNTHLEIDAHIASSSIHQPNTDTDTTYNAEFPLNLIGTTFSIQLASATGDGYLSSTDWNTFNDKSDSDTNTTYSADFPIILTGTAFSINVASATNDGYLSSTDWIIFNDKVSSTDFSTHTSSSAIHFVESSIDHTSIQNIGSNTHAQIDTHIASTSIHQPNTDTTYSASTPLYKSGTTFAIYQSNTSSSGYLSSTDWNVFNGKADESDLTDHTGSTSIHFLESSIDHRNIASVGSNTHFEIDAHIASTSLHSSGSDTTYNADYPIDLTGTTFSMSVASASNDGYISSTDWNTFNNKVSADGSINTHSDVDIVSEAPTKNDHLIFNGTKFVPAPDGTTFTFSCSGFSDGETTTQLIGVGDWKAAEAITFTATYNNGPPTTADIQKSINGAAYATINTMDGPAYTSGINTDAVAYPAGKDQYLRFRLESDDGTDSDTDYDSAIYFRNYVYWGESSTGASFSEADVEALSGSSITNSYNSSRTINAGVGEYLVLAYPSSYTSIHASGFRFNGVTCPFNSAETVSITNSAGFTENYKVFASVNTNLGNSTLQVYTSAQLIDPLYYGVTTKTDTYLESDVEGLANSTISNDNTQTWDSVNADTGEYLLFAFPVRLGVPTFYVGGFEGGFESPETVSVTNVNGYAEDYYVWRSTNSGLGATVVVTQ